MRLVFHARWLPVFTALALCACGADESEVAAAEESDARLSVSDSLARQSDRANQPPVIDALRLEPAEPRRGDAVRAIVEVSDPDGDPVRATYEWTLDGQPTGAGSAKLVLADAPRDTAFSVTVVASDGRTESAPMSASGRVANSVPLIDRVQIEPGQELTVGHRIEVHAETRDRDGDAVELDFTWRLNGLRESDRAEGPVFDTAGLEPGDVIELELVAEDGLDESETFVAPPLRVVNRPPRVLSRPGPAVAGRFRYRIDVEDPDGDTIQYELAQAPEGMQIEASGDIEWAPADDQSGVHEVRVIVDDLRGGAIAHDFELEVAPPASFEKGTL